MTREHPSTRERVAGAAKETTPDTAPSGQGERADIGNLPQSGQADRSKENGVSVRTQRKLDRLARDHPALHRQVAAGELSAHRAAMEAGIVPGPAYKLH